MIGQEALYWLVRNAVLVLAYCACHGMVIRCIITVAMAGVTLYLVELLIFHKMIVNIFQQGTSRVQCKT